MSVMKTPRFLAEEAKEISQPKTVMLAGLGTRRDLEAEQMRRASDLSLFSFSLFSNIDIWMSKRQVSKKDIDECIFSGGT